MNNNHNLIITGVDDVFHVELHAEILFTGTLQNCMDYIDGYLPV